MIHLQSYRALQRLVEVFEHVSSMFDGVIGDLEVGVRAGECDEALAKAIDAIADTLDVAGSEIRKVAMNLRRPN